LPEPVLVVGALGGLAAINCLGVVPGNGVQGTLGALKVAAIAALIVAGLWFVPAGAAGPAGGAPVDSVKSFGAAMIPVTFSYGGWQTANYVAGEMKDSARNLGRALLVGVLAVIALYLLVNIACLHALGVVALGQTLTPTSAVLERVAGAGGAKLAAAAIALSAFGFLSQGMLTGPRVFFAMARDGFLFRRVASVNTASQVPVGAIVLVAGWSGVLALSGSYEQILSYVIAMNFLFFGLSASCIFALRRRERQTGVMAADGYRAFGHPWTTGAFIVASGLIVVCSFWSFPVNSLIGYVIMLMGVPPFLYWRGRGAP
jgi:APA family basic amino acid/polyamine antiporter